MWAMKIIRARPRDAARLSEIALAAKSYWKYPAHWLEQWQLLLTVTPEDIRTHETYAAVEDGTRVGFYLLAGEPPVMTLEHLWVVPERIGQGIGRKLLLHAMAQARSLGALALDIEADPHAEGFYLHMGAHRRGERTYTLDGQARSLPLLRMRL